MFKLVVPVALLAACAGAKCGYVIDILDGEEIMALGHCQPKRDQLKGTRRVYKYVCGPNGELLQHQWDEKRSQPVRNAKKDCRAHNMATVETVDMTDVLDGFYDCGDDYEEVCDAVEWELDIYKSNDCSKDRMLVREYRLALETCARSGSKSYKWLCGFDKRAPDVTCTIDSADGCSELAYLHEFNSEDCSGDSSVIETVDQRPYGGPPSCVDGKALDVDCPSKHKVIHI